MALILAPAQRLKNANSTLYYDMLQWKEDHMNLFSKAIDYKNHRLCNYTEPQLIAIAMLTLTQVYLKK